MENLTEKQFKKALGHINLASKKWNGFIKNHPVEYTDEWLYEFAKYREGEFSCSGSSPIEANHNGLDYTTEGYYGVARYDQ